MDRDEKRGFGGKARISREETMKSVGFNLIVMPVETNVQKLSAKSTAQSRLTKYNKLLLRIHLYSFAVFFSDDWNSKSHVPLQRK